MFPADMQDENKGKEGKEGRKLVGVKGCAIGKGKCSKPKKEGKQESMNNRHPAKVQEEMKHEQSKNSRQKSRGKNGTEIGA
jgi:hypothetical protein